MKLLAALILAMSLIISLQSPVHAGNSVGNAGDIAAMEFSWVARLAVKRLKEAALTSEQIRQVAAIEAKLEVVTIVSLPKLVLDGKEVDAINYPEENLIELSQKRWSLFKGATAMSRVGFALHEFLWVAGFNDKQFDLSKALVDKIRDERFADVAFEESLLNSLWTLQWDLHNASLRPLPSERKKDDTKSYCFFAGRIRGQILTMDLFITHTSNAKVSKKNSEALKRMDEASRNIERHCQQDSKNPAILNELKDSVVKANEAIVELINAISSSSK